MGSLGIICANCGEGGGRLRYNAEKGVWFHPGRCGKDAEAVQTAKDLWGFETMNISSDPNQGPIQVKSLRHLRELEKEHGVVSCIGNYSQSNWDR